MAGSRWTPADLQSPRLAAMMPQEDRKALGLTTATEDTAAREAREESALQRICEQELHRAGIAYLHLSPRAREKAGWPDIVCVVQPQHPVPLAIELKSATGRLSEDQRQVLAQMQANGWTVRIVRRFDDFKSLIAGRTHNPDGRPVGERLSPWNATNANTPPR